MPESKRFFITGGTLSTDAPSYVRRPADDLLVDWVADGELCMVLAPRQMGKSSLMVNSLKHLREKGVCPVIVDLQSLGSYHEPDAWFAEIAYRIEEQVVLQTDVPQWWAANAHRGATSRFMLFLEQVVLKETGDAPVAIFFDEVDSTLSLPFSDEFFTTLRSLYNEKAHNPVLQRLRFVLLGVAMPMEFIKDRSRTPFNIGRQLELTDFNSDDLDHFREVLADENKQVVNRILYWTGGQPLMLQRMAETASTLGPDEKTPEAIDRVAETFYLAKGAKGDRHLHFIRNYLLKEDLPRRKLLKTYGKVLQAKTVAYDDQSPIHARLLLAGVVMEREGHLLQRNEIYVRVFDQNWIKRHIPADAVKRALWGVSIALVLVLSWFLVLKPLWWPDFIPFQKMEWQTENIYYKKQTHLFLDIPMPQGKFRKIIKGEQKIDHNPASESGKPQMLSLSCPRLEQGPNRFRIRFYGLWPGEKSYECNVVVVSLPPGEQRMPSAKIEMVTLPGGEFRMGCQSGDKLCQEDEKPVHSVTVSPFSIGKFEITQAQWEAVMGYNPSYFKACGEECPVENVSWHHIQEYIRRLNRLAGETYDLPTEAEWEYACRAGTETPIYSGKLDILGENNAPDLDPIAWYGGNSCVDYEGGWNCQDWKERQIKCSTCGTHQVGLKQANAFELHDMIGNVWEWCRDWYGTDYYSNSTNKNPFGPESGSTRVNRGGGWGNSPRSVRAANRSWNSPGFRSDSLGFRLVLRPVQ